MFLSASQDAFVTVLETRPRFIQSKLQAVGSLFDADSTYNTSVVRSDYPTHAQPGTRAWVEESEWMTPPTLAPQPDIRGFWNSGPEGIIFPECRSEEKVFAACKPSGNERS